jgi:hypothetical protein
VTTELESQLESGLSPNIEECGVWDCADRRRSLDSLPGRPNTQSRVWDGLE